jgi:ribosomal protein S18 acetylase RimI-like enzyme
MPRVRRRGVPPALFQHLLDRIAERKIGSEQLELMAAWLDREPEVKTFLIPGQIPVGKRVV